VILSDFQFCPQDVQRLGGDITAIAVGFGVDRCDTDKQQRMASSRMWAFDGGRARDVVVAYQQSIGGAGKPVAVEDLAISDELAAAIELQWHSWHPPTATVSGARIVWPLLAPSSPITATYRVRPLIDGLLPVSVMAEAVYTDSLGLTGRVTFPPVHIHVTAHTPTPSPTWTPTPTLTATATSTPTSTPTPAARYLPVARKHWPPPTPTEKPCIPEEETVDVALVIDTSTSMADPTRSGGPPKMTAAVQAAQALLALLKADDQTAVIGFNAEATVLQGLTADRDAVVRALAGLADTQAVGTSIYRGLAAARAELEGPRHRPDNNPSIVLVTDGRHNDPLHGLDDVRSLAAAILADGIEIVTVGLGTDIDDDLLRDIASTPDYYFRAPDAADLLDIYREIARLIPCP
jgi:Mg-chelatase subunit ChlD